MSIATQTEKTEIKSVAKDTVNGLIRAVTELEAVKIMITTKKKRGLKMPEYIKFEPLRDEILNDVEYDGDTVNHFLGIVDSQPAADVAEVKHGEWIPIPEYENKRCSVCSTVFSDFTLGYYCPKCGAKMDQKEGVKSDL